jgi:hypothetical protein
LRRSHPRGRGRGGGGRDSRPLSGQASPHLSGEGAEEPLDFLLEMVRRQRVDLRPLSILTLTGRLVAAIENGDGHIRLERRADWLAARPQLRQAVFSRGRAPLPARPQAELYVAFLEAMLVMAGASLMRSGASQTCSSITPGVCRWRAACRRSRQGHPTGRCACGRRWPAPSSRGWSLHATVPSWSYRMSRLDQSTSKLPSPDRD